MQIEKYEVSLYPPTEFAIIVKSAIVPCGVPDAASIINGSAALFAVSPEAMSPMLDIELCIVIYVLLVWRIASTPVADAP